MFRFFFVSSNQIHQHNTRNASKLYKHYKRTNYAKHMLFLIKVLMYGTYYQSNIKDINFSLLSKNKLNSIIY